MTPFHVQCQTCRTYLRVTKPEAIGLILGCPKCNGMVEVQPPPDWHDTDGEVTPTSAAPAATTTATAEYEETTVASSRWMVPGIALGAMLCAGLLSWVVWTQLREPDRAEPAPPIAAGNQESKESEDSASNPALAAPITETPANNDQTPPAPPPSVAGNEPATANNNPAAVVPEDPPAAADLPLANQPALPETTPPKPKLVLLPEQPPAASNEPSLFARGPEANPGNVSQTKPAAEGDDQPGFTPSEPMPAEPPSAIAPVVAAPLAAPLEPRPFQLLNPKKLELTLAAVAYEQVPLHAFLREMGDLAGVEIGVDDAVLFRNGWRLNTPVRVQLENVTVRGALQAALRPLELDLLLKENYLWVTQTVNESLHLTRYPIDDLLSKSAPAAEAEELSAQLQRAVPGQRWAAGKVEIVPGALLITQSSAVHDELIVWFEKLRVARGLPLRTKYDPANAQLRRFAPQRFAMMTRWQAAEQFLSKPVTINFAEPESLRVIIDILSRQTNAVISWDLPALMAAGISPESTTTLALSGIPLSKALETLLDAAGLMIVPLDDASLLVTTKSAGARRSVTERYSLARILEQRRWTMDEAVIAAGIRQELTARGIESPETIPLAWDRASRTLAVAASPAVHRALEKFLGDLPQKPVAAAALIKK